MVVQTIPKIRSYQSTRSSFRRETVAVDIFLTVHRRLIHRLFKLWKPQRYFFHGWESRLEKMCRVLSLLSLSLLSSLLPPSLSLLSASATSAFLTMQSLRVKKIPSHRSQGLIKIYKPGFICSKPKRFVSAKKYHLLSSHLSANEDHG